MSWVWTSIFSIRVFRWHGHKLKVITARYRERSQFWQCHCSKVAAAAVAICSTVFLWWKMVEGRIRIPIKKNLFQNNLSKECEKVNRWALKFLMPSRNSKWFQHENTRGQSLHVFAILIYSVSSPDNANIREKPDMLKWSSDLFGWTAPATTSPPMNAAS